VAHSRRITRSADSGLMGRSNDAREPKVLAATFLLRLPSLAEELSG
jgi:hypothetical protein